MRHSRQIALVLLGTVSAMSLAACTQDTSNVPRDGAPIYRTQSECEMDKSATECADAFRYALSSHLSNTRTYAQEDACKAQHESCMQVSPSGTPVWLPAMMGYIVGSSINRSRPVYLQDDKERKERQMVAGGHGSPIIVGNWGGGSWVPSGGTSSTSTSSRASVGGAAPPRMSVSTPASSRAATTVSVGRGGFGASGAGHGAGT